MLLKTAAYQDFLRLLKFSFVGIIPAKPHIHISFIFHRHYTDYINDC